MFSSRGFVIAIATIMLALFADSAYAFDAGTRALGDLAGPPKAGHPNAAMHDYPGGYAQRFDGIDGGSVMPHPIRDYALTLSLESATLRRPAHFGTRRAAAARSRR